jgi:hypothetical protein
VAGGRRSIGLRSNRKIDFGLIHRLLQREKNKRMKSVLFTTVLASPVATLSSAKQPVPWRPDHARFDSRSIFEDAPIEE